MPSDAHYPDVVAAGSLVAAVSEALARAGSALRAGDPHGDQPAPYAYARVGHGSRFSQITIARDLRLFFVDFWADHLYLAKSSSTSLPDVAGVLTSWLTDELSPSDLVARHPAIRLEDLALSYERGTVIADAWRSMLERDWDQRVFGDLGRFVATASEHPVLSRMRPYTTLWRFSVSPNPSPAPGYPCVEAVGPGRFAVKDYFGRTVYGEGDARQAADLLVAQIAEHDR